MSAWSKQQTIETFRANQELHAEKSRAEYKAEKLRRYKLSLIRKWREKK